MSKYVCSALSTCRLLHFFGGFIVKLLSSLVASALAFTSFSSFADDSAVAPGLSSESKPTTSAANEVHPDGEKHADKKKAHKKKKAEHHKNNKKKSKTSDTPKPDHTPQPAPAQ